MIRVNDTNTCRIFSSIFFSRNFKKCVIIIIIIFIPASFLIFYLNVSKNQNCDESKWCDLHFKLNKIYSDLQQSNINRSVLLEYENILKSIQCDNTVSPNSVTSQNIEKRFLKISPNVSVAPKQLLDVCPEEWMGMMYGYNKWYLEGFITVKCTNAKPFPNVVSILLNFAEHSKGIISSMSNVLVGISKTYRNLTVHIAVTNDIPTHEINFWFSLPLNLLIYNVSIKHPSIMWSQMLQDVKTPYVFVGRDLEDFSFHARLERQIRILSYFPNVGIVGGGNRDPHGNWTYDCYQMTLSNYILKYEDGYYKSKNECMYCEHLNGPFMAKSEILRKFELNEESNVFSHLFVQVKQSKNVIIMSCPDAMNFVHGTTNLKKKDWQNIAVTWKLNRILLPPNVVHKFTCQEVKLKCNLLGLTRSYLAPPCCLEILAEATNFFIQVCEKIGLVCYADGGTLIAAVKMYGPMPWDWDIDTFYDGSYYYLLKNESRNFETHGYKIEWAQYEESCCQNNKTIPYVKAHIYSYGMENDVFPEKSMAGYTFPGKPPTKVKFGNYYIYVPINPGSYIRNHYGIEVLKHVQNWMVLKHRSSYDEYKSGHFLSCVDPKSHACLDHFEPDGNILYRIPN